MSTATRNGAHRSAGAIPGLVLFAEDFDAPPICGAAPEPDVIEPMFTKAELEAACQQAWRTGHDAATAAFAEANAAGIRDAIAAIAAGMVEAPAEAAAMAQQTADALARLLFDSFAAAFPSLCAIHGEAELRNLVRAILPALQQEPSVSIRVNPVHATAIHHEILSADPDLATRLEIIESETVRPGDIRIAWRAGQATRDADGLWQQIAEILAPAGFASYAATKECEHVE